MFGIEKGTMFGMGKGFYVWHGKRDLYLVVCQSLGMSIVGKIDYS